MAHHLAPILALGGFFKRAGLQAITHLGGDQCAIQALMRQDGLEPGMFDGGPASGKPGLRFSLRPYLCLRNVFGTVYRDIAHQGERVQVILA